MRQTEPEFMTVAEAAAVARLSEEHTRNLLREGRLPGKRLCGTGSWRVPRAALEKLLQGETNQRGA